MKRNRVESAKTDRLGAASESTNSNMMISKEGITMNSTNLIGGDADAETKSHSVVGH